jgi:hypothetical protein
VVAKEPSPVCSSAARQKIDSTGGAFKGQGTGPGSGGDLKTADFAGPSEGGDFLPQKDRGDFCRRLRMIRCFGPQICVKQRFPGRFLATALGLDGDKHGIDLGQCLGIVGLERPPAIGL